MKNIEELKQCLDVDQLTLYLEYTEMIEDMMTKRGIVDDQLQEEKEILKERISFLSQNR